MAESQSSTVSYVPSELILDQDDAFVERLNEVEYLYFSNTVNGSNVGPFIERDSSDEESDVENDAHLDFCEVWDLRESADQQKFKTETCKCREFYGGTPCSEKVDWETVV
ncbi:hypothetical protein KUTeg_012055 [Tegillarca granosa]|uniref:Uncharacterized protein n=1 Tax=Tegillarca granosa TaxID=220873 RepID=A0ABQ9EYF8_TEGGR|nr:hypothetical protein KUTeg_012055 [Tegillarca granosa]